MKNVINIYKPIGMTPLQLIEEFKKNNPKYLNKKIGYAGRLDPMAHGVMILLVEPETKNRDKYQKMRKEYEFEVLFGISSDTYDVMGVPEMSDLSAQSDSKSLILEGDLNEYVENLIGKHNQPYPPYSSKPVGGKPLYYWSREGKLDEIEIPEKEIEIFSARLIDTGEINTHELLRLINKNVSLAQGDFRQKEILEEWEEILSRSDINFQTAKFRVECSSGTYVRGIANEMGKHFGIGSLALDIERSNVGNYNLQDSIQ